MSILDEFQERVSKLQNETQEKPLDDIDFDANFAELSNVMKGLGPLIEALNGILPEADLEEMNKSFTEANSCLDSMAVELEKLKQIREEYDAFFEKGKTE